MKMYYSSANSTTAGDSTAVGLSSTDRPLVINLLLTHAAIFAEALRLKIGVKS